MNQRRFFGLVTLSLLVGGLSQAQDWEFQFDSSGNLASQNSGTSAPPQILKNPQLQIVGPGEPASFSVVVANTFGLSYQWRFNDADVPGATTDSILITNASPADQGLYSVVLVNGSGSVTSAPASLMLDGDFDGLPGAWELAYFGNGAQLGSGDYDNDGVSNADEFHDGTNPTNSASAFFRLNVIANGGLVQVVPSRLKYTNGEVVTLTAIAYAPEIFHGWTGDIIARTNVISLIMTTNRIVMAHFQPLILNWGTFSSGSWHLPTNWDPPVIPTMEDRVFVTNSSDPTITINEPADSGLLTIGTATGGSNPVLTGPGTLTIHTNGIWSNGHMSGSGRTVIAPWAALLINGPPSSAVLNNRTLENGGTVRMTGTSGLVLNGGVITNRAGALFLIETIENQFTITFATSGGINRIDNAGTFRKTSSGTTRVSGGTISFNNSGLVELVGGSLELFGGGTHSGSFDVPAGRTLVLSGGTNTASASSTLTGAGNLTVNNGAANFAGLVNLKGTHAFDGGSATFTGNFICTNNTITIGGGGGTANFSGTGMVQPSELVLAAGTLGGSSAVTVLNQMIWSGGAMSGSGRTFLAPGATASINGSISLNRTLDNAGTVLWSGAGSIAMSSAVVSNRPGALFRSLSAGSLALAGGVNRFDNAGTFHHVASGTMLVFGNVSFNNYGASEIRNGTLALNGGGLNNGTMDVWTPATLQISGGTFNSSAASSITGAGRLTVAAGTANLAGEVTLRSPYLFSGGVANLTGNFNCTNNTITISQGTANFSGTGLVQPTSITQSGGVLAGNNTVTVLNQMNWTGGGMSGSSRTIIPPGATLTISGANGVSLTTRILDNGGTIFWSGTGPFSLASAVITNRPGALFEAQSGASLTLASGVNRLDNAGTFRKTTAATTTIFGGINVNNYGTIDLRRGILAANGAYNSTSNALLHLGVAGTTAGSGHGRLQVGGAVALNGSLSVAFLNGFQPAVNDSFTLLTAGTRSGTFATFSYPSNDVTLVLSNTPTSVVAYVTSINTNVVVPLLRTPEISGSDLKLTWMAVSNRTYRVEFKTDLNATNWNALSGDVIGVSNTASKLDVLTPSNRFYRVFVVP